MGMVTLILRLHDDPSGELKGTIEEPGKDPALFRDGSELMAVLEALASQVGNGLGSTSSSPILET